MSPDPMALRIVRRHQAAVLPREVPTTTFRVEFDCGGRISWIGLKLALEPLVGYLKKLRFCPSLVGTPPTVAWEGVTGTGELVTGTLVIQTVVGEDEVRSWAEVVPGG